MSNLDTLNRAIDALVQRQRIHLYREDTRRSEWQTLPSILEQLEGAVSWSGSGNGGGTFGSRPTIATEVVSLLIEISAAAAEVVKDAEGKQRGDITANLRALAVIVTTPNTDHDPDWWTEQITNWTQQARTALRLDPSRPTWARGTACPDCAATTALTTRDGEQIRTPALAISWTAPDRDHYHGDNGWKVRAVECRCCGATWFRGTDLDALVEQMLAANLAKETMAG